MHLLDLHPAGPTCCHLLNQSNDASVRVCHTSGVATEWWTSKGSSLCILPATWQIYKQLRCKARRADDWALFSPKQQGSRALIIILHGLASCMASTPSVCLWPTSACALGHHVYAGVAKMHRSDAYSLYLLSDSKCLLLAGQLPAGKPVSSGWTHHVKQCQVEIHSLCCVKVVLREVDSAGCFVLCIVQQQQPVHRQADLLVVFHVQPHVVTEPMQQRRRAGKG